MPLDDSFRYSYKWTRRRDCKTLAARWQVYSLRAQCYGARLSASALTPCGHPRPKTPPPNVHQHCWTSIRRDRCPFPDPVRSGAPLGRMFAAAVEGSGELVVEMAAW